MFTCCFVVCHLLSGGVRVRQYDFFFFFQAEDGIRDADVTGVQTCALPISTVSLSTRTNRVFSSFCSRSPIQCTSSCPSIISTSYPFPFAASIKVYCSSLLLA